MNPRSLLVPGLEATAHEFEADPGFGHPAGEPLGSGGELAVVEAPDEPVDLGVEGGEVLRVRRLRPDPRQPRELCGPVAPRRREPRVQPPGLHPLPGLEALESELRGHPLGAPGQPPLEVELGQEQPRRIGQLAPGMLPEQPLEPSHRLVHVARPLLLAREGERRAGGQRVVGVGPDQGAEAGGGRVRVRLEELLALPVERPRSRTRLPARDLREQRTGEASEQEAAEPEKQREARIPCDPHPPSRRGP